MISTFKLKCHVLGPFEILKELNALIPMGISRVIQTLIKWYNSGFLDSLLSSVYGRVERANRTILEITLSLHFAANLGEEFLEFAAQTAVFLKNRRHPHSALHRITPYQVRYGRVPDLSNFEVSLVPSQLDSQTKLLRCVTRLKNNSKHTISGTLLHTHCSERERS